MNPEQLLTHYERVADAPDAIARLRQFIVEIAVLGRLVGQEDEAELSADLLRLAPQETEGRSGLPQGWTEARTGKLLNFQYGKSCEASRRLENGPVPVYGSNGIIGYTQDALTESPAIIVGRKGSAGALNLCNGASWATDVAYFVECPPFFHIRYLLLALKALGLERLGKGVKPGLSRSDAYDQPLRVPPLGIL